MIRQSMLTYRNDVCSPNLAEMRDLLQAGGYQQLPAPYNGEDQAFGLDELPAVQTDVINAGWCSSGTSSASKRS